MCENQTLVNVIGYGYIVLCFLIPIIYLIMFKSYRSKRKNYFRAFIIAIMMFIILFSFKAIAYLSNIEKANCLINGIHFKDNEGETMTTTSTTTTTTTTTTIETTTTTTTTANTSNSSNKISFDVLNPPKENRVYVGKTSKGYDIYTINGVTYINDLLIVNKTYSWNKNIEPSNTATSTKGVTKVCNNCINKTVMSAWKEMKADAAADKGFNLWIQSGYRPFEAQNNIYNNYVKRDGKAEADTYSARPNNTEHSTTICFDINNPSRSFNNTAEAKWITENCWKYGFIIRYPKDKQNETGYIYESWHVRYVGKELAEELYNNGDWITLESYLGITSVYAD